MTIKFNPEIPPNNDGTPDGNNSTNDASLANARLLEAAQGKIARPGDATNRSHDAVEAELRRQLAENDAAIAAATQRYAASLTQSLSPLVNAPIEHLQNVLKESAGYYLPHIEAMLKDVAQLHPENQTVVKAEATLTNSKDPRVAQIVMDHLRHITDGFKAGQP